MAGDSIGPLVYRGRREIAQAVGIPEKEIMLYVEKYGLPAFKIDGTGGWKARPQDLERWVEKMAEIYRGTDLLCGRERSFVSEGK